MQMYSTIMHIYILLSAAPMHSENQISLDQRLIPWLGRRVEVPGKVLDKNHY